MWRPWGALKPVDSWEYVCRVTVHAQGRLEMAWITHVWLTLIQVGIEGRPHPVQGLSAKGRRQWFPQVSRISQTAWWAKPHSGGRVLTPACCLLAFLRHSSVYPTLHIECFLKETLLICILIANPLTLLNRPAVRDVREENLTVFLQEGYYNINKI